MRTPSTRPATGAASASETKLVLLEGRPADVPGAGAVSPRSWRRADGARGACRWPGDHHETRIAGPAVSPADLPPGKGNRRSLNERDFIALIDGVHQLVRAPIVLVWGRLNTHVSHRMRELVDQRESLAVFLLPAYSPDLNLVEWGWAHVARSMANLSPPSTTCRYWSATGPNASSTVPNSSMALL